MERSKPFVCVMITVLSTVLVLSGGGGCKEIFEKALDNQHVVLVAPVNGLVSADSSQTFYWQPVDSNINYEIQIVTPSFDSVVELVLDSNISTNHFQVVLGGDSYQWRVRAYNSSSTTPYTTPWNLTIQ